MTKELLQSLIDKNYSIRKISKELNLSFGLVKYQLKKHGLKTTLNVNNKSTNNETKRCPICELILDKKMFYNNGKTGYCKTCHSTLHKEKSFSRKKWAINYKGNKCLDCNCTYPEYPHVVFDFHHLDRTTKEMEWQKTRFSSEEKMIKELDKCILLCCRCHRIREYNMVLENKCSPDPT